MSGADSFDIRAYGDCDTARQIYNQYVQWKDHRTKIEDRWLEVRQYLYATTSSETTNSGVGGFSVDPVARQGWSHTTHIPKLTQISDNLSANYMMALFSRPDWIQFVGHDASAAMQEKRDVVEGYILTKCSLNGFRNELQKCIDDWIQTGNCFGSVEYVTEKHIDPETNEETIGYQGPKFCRISPYDIIYNPIASSFERTPKITYSLMSMSELLREVEENPEKGYLAEAVKKAGQFRVDANSVKDRYINKYKHLEIAGFSSAYEYLKSGVVEVLEFHGDLYNYATGEFKKNRVITIIDRSFVIRDEPIKTWDGKPHIYHCGWRTRPESLWAMGPLENLVGLQYLVNHLQNTKADAFDEFVVPSVVTKGDVTEEGSKFGGLLAQRYHIDGVDGAVELLRPDPTFLQAKSEIDYYEQLMESFAGSPKEAMGFRTPGEKTAFEVQTLQNAAARIFQNKIDYFSEQFLEKIVNGMIEVARRNLSTADMIQVTDRDYGAMQFMSVTKEDILANGHIVPVGSRHFAEQARLAQTLQVLQQVLGPEEKMHIRSVDIATAFVQASDIENLLPVIPFVRLGEQAQAQQLMSQLQENSQMVQGGPPAPVVQGVGTPQ